MNINGPLFEAQNEAAERSRLINAIYNPHSEAFIQRVLAQPRGNVLEIGCGYGFMSRWFAEQPEVNSVLAIDTDTLAIDYGIKLCQAANLHTINFKVLSVYDLDFIKEKFDVIYFRFLLIHLTNPIAALRAIYHKVKPEGRVICETALGASST